MKRGRDLEARERAYMNSRIDPAAALLKARLPSLIRAAIEHELSDEPPAFVAAADAQTIHFKGRWLQVIATGLLNGARAHVRLCIAKVIAEHLADPNTVETWLRAKREREAHAQREFDEYQQEYRRDQRQRVISRARLERIRSGPIATDPASMRERVVSLERAALRARLDALQLPRIQ